MNVFKFSYYPWRYIRNWGHNFKQFFINIKWAFQRATRGYCDFDLWDLDYFYTKLFIDTLKNFSEKNQGIPNAFYNKDDEQASVNAWSDYIMDMREDFVKTLEALEADTPEEWEEKSASIDDGLNKLKKVYYDLWW